MCGIIGVVTANAVGEYVERLVNMRDSMTHRGPDDQGIWWSANGWVGFGHRRLAIIDLSPAGHQPMSDISGEYCITFNGEIYNYRELRRELESRGHQFRSASDTEVILEAYRAWGAECLKHLNGMFAFAIYDLKKRQVFMARDRAGEKPFFYQHSKGKFVFASELKALMADSSFVRQLDLQSLDYYLAYGYVPGAKCILQGVNKLAPAHAAIYELENDRLRTWRYWQPPAPMPDPKASAEDLEQELESLLLDSVRQRLIADVPVGVLLSGGVDSSLVTVLAARTSSKPVRTFTISFPGHGSYDEGPYARMVAQHCGAEHTELVAEPATVELLPQLARQYDEPIADSSMVPTFLVSQAVRKHATVALGGDGGDELFGGYGHYSFLQQQEKIRHLLPKSLREYAGRSAGQMMAIGMKGRNHLIGFGSDLSHSIAHVNLYFDAETRHQLLLNSPANHNGDGGPEEYKVRLCNAGYSALQQATRADFQTTMVDAYLVKVDRASMLASLEVRSPFLDQGVIEMAFGRVPDALRASNKERKILLRRIGARLLPKELNLTRKQGFSMPLQSWFKGEWGNYIEGVLAGAPPELFNQAVIRQIFAGQRQGRHNEQRLYALAIFELWRREYQIGV